MLYCCQGVMTMAFRSLDMVAQMREVSVARRKNDSAAYRKTCCDLLCRGYGGLTDACRACGDPTAESTVFYAFQHILTYLILSDGDFLQGEYDLYAAFCRSTGFSPLTVGNVRQLYRDLHTDDLVRDIRLIAAMRPQMPADDFEALTRGMCFLALIGDKTFDEDEYRLLRCLYDKTADKIPDSWEDFKSQW